MKNGSAGGRETVRRHGRRHMQEIGRKGYESTLARHFQGDRLAFQQWLTARAWESVIDALADREIDRQLATGAETACFEIPIMSDLDDPF